MKRFKKGAASFYIVAFSTLILVIIATSFATVIISEVTRTANDDLSQSAYDSALAGVEDAKLAFSNYRRCREKLPSFNPEGYTPDPASGVKCEDIIYWVEKAPDCDMVAHILGRIGKGEKKEVMISDTTTTSGSEEVTINQAYTCVMITTDLEDYRANLSASNQTKVVGARFANGVASKIKTMKISWYSVREADAKWNYANFTDGKVTFKPVNLLQIVTPPTLAVSLIQTATNFSLSDFNQTVNGRTDRATMYLVPINSKDAASKTNEATYKGVYKGGDKGNVLTQADVYKTNDHNIKNLPYGVYCDEAPQSNFACSVSIELPQPIGGTRDDDTFTLIVSLPYAQPDTDFAVEFFCAENETCSSTINDGVTVGSNVIKMENVQVKIDSTGRANDLYRRVETRLESTDVSFPYQYYALELMGDGDVLTKNMVVTCEYNFGATCQ